MCYPLSPFGRSGFSCMPRRRGCSVVVATLAVAWAGRAGAWPTTIDGLVSASDVARSVAVDPAGDVVATGLVLDTTPGIFVGSFPVVKLAGDSGGELWRATLNGPTDEFEDYANAIAVDASGNAIAAGVVYHAVESDPWFTIAKFAAADGALEWKRDFHESYRDYANAVAVDAAGDAVAVRPLDGRGFLLKVRGTDGPGGL